MSELLDIAVEKPCTQLTETCTCIQYTDTHALMHVSIHVLSHTNIFAYTQKLHPIGH